MRLYIQAGQVAIEGTFSEYDKCYKIAEELNNFLDNYISIVDNSEEDDNITDIGLCYDTNDYTLKDVKEFYRIIKSKN